MTMKYAYTDGTTKEEVNKLVIEWYET